MTNREKYLFDDFTLENYQRLIKLAIEKGFQFLVFSDEFESHRKDILWRHDVEFEPDVALKMAVIEKNLGVKANYFFQIHSQYYNLFDAHYTEVFHKILNLGHNVGLHFDSHYYNIEDESQLNKYIKLDCDYFEAVLGVKIDSYSFHNTNAFTQSCQKYTYGGLINVYSTFFKEKYKYCGDSLGYWRFDRLEDVLNDDGVMHLQVLTHDANWTEEILSPRKRVRKFVDDKAVRMYNGQVYGLINKGMLCPDDED